MVKIRLQRMGAKKNPQYVIVATNQGAARDGSFFEKIGFYYPKAKENKDKVKIDQAKFDSWKQKGAQVSLTVEQVVNAAKVSA